MRLIALREFALGIEALQRSWMANRSLAFTSACSVYLHSRASQWTRHCWLHRCGSLRPARCAGSARS